MGDVPEILGHDSVLARFRDALARDRLHHAWLLEGPPGVGKHTVARWLALAGTCEAPTARPCGACPTCRRVLAGTHPDVITVGPDADRATVTIGPETMRDVIRTAGFHRFSARRRFVLIDPADALQPAAANALLKTLEEPPAGTHFVLVAALGSALLPTILSRCQRVRLAPVPEAVLVPWLEARGVGDPTLLARVAQGCPGRALGLAGGAFDERLALRARLLQTLGGDLQGVFAFSEEVGSGGRRQDWMARAEAVLDLLEELLRDVVVLAAGGERPLIHADLAPVVEAWRDALWPSGVARCERAVTEARTDLALNVNGKTALDALLTRLATELGPARAAGRHTAPPAG